MLLGLIKPDSGDLRLHGKPIAGPGTDRAMVFQEFGLLPWRTVQHNVELGLELKGVAAATRRYDLASASSTWSGSPASRAIIRTNCPAA